MELGAVAAHAGRVPRRRRRGVEFWPHARDLVCGEGVEGAVGVRPGPLGSTSDRGPRLLALADGPALGIKADLEDLVVDIQVQVAADVHHI